MIDDSQLILKEFLHSNCIDQMIQYIKEKHINILHLDYGKKQTIFHTAIQRNDNQLLKFLEQYCYDNYKEQEIRKLINAYNIEMFTALHLASYSGNMEAVKILTQMGADSTIKSGSGLLPIHAAAQGDQPYIIWYWLQQGIQINVQDDLGNTCLHWATYQNCELTVNYLIAYGCEIDFLNNQKQTSLHIGSLYGQTRIVKKLLIKGAKRDMEDEDGQLPINLTDSIQIRKMLEDKMDLALFYNLKQPYHPLQRNRKSILVFYFIIITSQICIGQILWNQNRQLQILIFIITQLILIIISLLTQFSNAGIIKRKININDAINEQIDPQKICPDCWVQKPERSKHCEFCKKCIIVYDHHCPWINNCVGAKNLLYFYFYLLFLILLQLESISFIILYIIRINSLTIIDYIIISYPLICITIFIFPITALFIYQTKNIYYGITTYERISGKKVNIKASLLFPEENIQDSQSGDLEIEPSFQNCYNQCIKNKKIFKKYL